MTELEEGCTKQFQPTLPARGATGQGAVHCSSDNISTHAPRTGSDSKSSRVHRRKEDFNPRSPHGERPYSAARVVSLVRISTHAPRTGSDVPRHVCFAAVLISTHAPRTGSDDARGGLSLMDDLFQPTLPARGATIEEMHKGFGVRISTHAPRTGSDTTRTARCWKPAYFNPRSPHGERLFARRYCTARNRFQPTLPARGATLLTLLWQSAD